MSNVTPRGAAPVNDSMAPRLERISVWLIPILLGLRSLMLGQDSNWDQSNYHLYNAFALLQGKLHTDLAPAGFQTYFNPLLDVVTYLLYQALPAPLVGFIFGCWHGLAFICLLSIARDTLTLAGKRSRYMPLTFGIAGCLTANFLSGLGNGMGDDTTAVFVLAGIALASSAFAGHGMSSGIFLQTPSAVSRTPWPALVSAGVLVGVGVGLKLTNVIYAVALTLACVAISGPLTRRIVAILATGIGITVGLALTGGFWFWEMWVTFRNPLFPQFGHFFPNPLAGSTRVVDTSWLPKSWLEAILWPLIFTIDPKRVGQVIVRELLWPCLFFSGVIWAGLSLWRMGKRNPPTIITGGGALVCLFVLIAYILWLALFSVIRYVVPMEMLTPLAAYLVVTDIVRSGTGRRIAIVIIIVSSAVVIAGGAKTWGHQKWAANAFRADTPQIADPNKSTVVIVGGDPAMGWLAMFFPPSLAFTQIGGDFPGSKAYRDAVRGLYEKRGGAIYGIFNAAPSPFISTEQKFPEKTKVTLLRYDFELVPGSCSTHDAYIGRGRTLYRWCQLLPKFP